MFKPRTRLIVGAVAVGVSVLAMSACSSSDGAGGSGPVTLRVAANYGSQTDENNINKLVHEFEAANPNIKVNVSFSPVTSFDQVLGTEISSGNDPDIIYGSVGSVRPSGSLALAQKGVLMDVSNQSWTSQIPDVFKDLVGVNGKVYAWPQDVNFEGTIYNTTVLNKVGVQIPRTWSEVLTYCQKMKAAGIAPYTVNFGDEFGGFQLLYALVGTTVYANDPTWDFQRAQQKTTFASTNGWSQGMNQMLQLKNAGCFVSNPTSVSIAQSEGQVATGKAGGFPILSIVYTQTVAMNPADKFTFAPFPAEDSNNYAIAGPLNAWSVTKNTKYPTQALDWLKFVASAEQNRGLAAENGAIAMVDYAQQKMPSYFDPQYTTLVTNKQVSGIPLTWPSGVQDTVLGPGMQSLFLGRTSVSALLGQMDTAWNSGA